jgi:hypothetical protein
MDLTTLCGNKKNASRQLSATLSRAAEDLPVGGIKHAARLTLPIKTFVYDGSPSVGEKGWGSPFRQGKGRLFHNN